MRPPNRIGSCLVLLGCIAFSAARLVAWEGHEWSKWQQVTTWEKPRVQSDQAGQGQLLPLMLGGTGVTNSALTEQEWQARRRQLAATIGGILGAPSDLQKPPVEVREVGSEDLDTYTRRHVMIRAEADDWIPAYLLVPKQLAAPRVPAMLCLHQTVAQGKEEPCGIKGDAELAFAVELVKRGFVCLAPDAIGFGERIPAGKQPYHDSLAFYRKHPGWSYMGKMVWDTGRAIDYLETLPMVDPKRIGSIGHSYGAYGTFFAAAFEPRIAAAVASCGFTTFRSDPNPERWSHLTALIPQLGFYLPDAASIPFDWQHVVALAAPRPLFVWYATQDTIFPRTENLKGCFETSRQCMGSTASPTRSCGRHSRGHTSSRKSGASRLTSGLSRRLHLLPTPSIPRRRALSSLDTWLPAARPTRASMSGLRPSATRSLKRRSHGWHFLTSSSGT